MFWNTFVSLCNKQHKSPNAVCAELNFSTATATKWKNGATPRDTTLQKIANYFGVTTDYLLTGTSTPFKDADTDNDELDQYLEELRNRPEMRMLFSLAKGASKEDVERAVAIIEVLRKNSDD